MRRARKNSVAGRRPFLASFFSPSKSSPASRLGIAGARPGSRRQARVMRQAAVAGPGTFLGQLAGSVSTSQDYLRDERRRRRRAVRDQYMKELRGMKESRARAERELDKNLARRERVIAHQRGVYEVDPDNPRQVAAQEFASARFHTVERRQREQHKEQWDEAKRELERGRDTQYRQISQQLRQERRQQLGGSPAARGAASPLLSRLPGLSGDEGSFFAGRMQLPPLGRGAERGRDWRVGDPGRGPNQSGASPDAGPPPKV